MMNFLWVFIDGGIGSVLRYAVGLCIGAATFPLATLAVNVGGSFAIGLFGGWGDRFLDHRNALFRPYGELF